MSELKVEHIINRLIRDNTPANWHNYPDEDIAKLAFESDGSLSLTVVDGDGDRDRLYFSKEDIQNHLSHLITIGRNAEEQLNQYNKMFK